MTMYRKQIIVGYHPSNVIEAAVRYLYRFDNGQALCGLDADEQANIDHALLAGYRDGLTDPFNFPVYLQDLAFHKWVRYLVASEYAARALDDTQAFPNGLQ